MQFSFTLKFFITPSELSKLYFENFLQLADSPLDFPSYHYLFDLRLPGQDRSLIVPPSLLLFLSLRELALYFISWTRLHRLSP
jgi:hypothetical protein